MICLIRLKLSLAAGWGKQRPAKKLLQYDRRCPPPPPLVANQGAEEGRGEASSVLFVLSLRSLFANRGKVVVDLEFRAQSTTAVNMVVSPY